MKTYLVYFNYNDQDYFVWGINKDLDLSIKQLKEDHLPMLIEACQSDVSRISLIETELPDDLYSLLLDSVGNIVCTDVIKDFFRTLEDTSRYPYKVIYRTDGMIRQKLLQYYWETRSVSGEAFDEDLWDDKMYKHEESEPDSFKLIVNEFINKIISPV